MKMNTMPEIPRRNKMPRTLLWERMVMNINPEGSILYVLALLKKIEQLNHLAN